VRRLVAALGCGGLAPQLCKSNGRDKSRPVKAVTSYRTPNTEPRTFLECGDLSPLWDAAAWRRSSVE
jgi:hypothetical protein